MQTYVPNSAASFRAAFQGFSGNTPGHMPDELPARLQTIQLVQVTAGSALVVIVTDQGVIRDSVIRISPDVEGDTLYAISRTLTNELKGCTLREACRILPNLIRRMEGNDEVLQGLYGYFSEGQQNPHSPHIAVGGTSNMLSYPEYSDVDKARTFLSLMETRDKLAEIVRGSGELAFTVRIGPETGVPEMADCSIVTATYSTRGGQQGTIGVIGPTRMRYSKVISILNVMGHQLTDMFTFEDDRPGKE